MILDYIGSWGDRVESLHDSARRMQRSWQLVSTDSDAYSDWAVKTSDGSPQSLLNVPTDNLGAIEDAVRRVTERVNDGPRSTPGFNLEFVRTPEESSEARYEYKVRCGYGGPRALRNHVLMELDPVVSRASSTEDLLGTYLRALVRAWEPDYMSVCSYDFQKAQGYRKPQEVRVGWLTYICRELAADLPSSHGEQWNADGGVYIKLAGTPQEPDLDEARAIRSALGY